MGFWYLSHVQQDLRQQRNIRTFAKALLSDFERRNTNSCDQLIVLTKV